MKTITTFLLLFISVTLISQRPMERLSRGAVAQRITGGIYVNWRITADEYLHTSYRLYRDGNLIHETGINGASNFTDPAGNEQSVYTITSLRKGVESAPSKPARMLTNGYWEIPLRDLKPLGKTEYYPNDATTADLDGDGDYEIILKRMRRDWSTTNTQYTMFEAYKLDGTFLWAIDVGPNITNDVEINIAAFDFDGDGKAEVFMRTSEGTVFGDGTKIGDTNGDGITNYRSSINSSEGYMNAGPEFLSLIDGETGKELDRVPYIARGNSSDWGDNYGHRANKFFFGAPYLDGKKPSIFIGRGIYTQIKMQTFDVVNKKLVHRWSWESGNNWPWAGQGFHNFVVADLDGDGRDEINYGNMAINHDGKGLFTTGLGHGDAQHVTDLDPYRKGQEVFVCLETNPGTHLHCARTGQTLFHHIMPRDVGRAGAGNISDLHRGAEIWGGGIGASATDRVSSQHYGVAENFLIYWDGDLFREILDHSGFSTSTGVGWGHITKFRGYGNIQTLLNAQGYSCNYTKGTPNLQADLFGDWREEAIWWRPDSMALRIYSTPFPTQHRIYTLMHDHQYRQAIAWQMCGYNQPPHPSFYLGTDFPTPIPPKATNGKLIWKGNTNEWSLSATNWMDGNNATGLISGNAPTVAFSNGESILIDTHGSNKNINISENIYPEGLTMAGPESYTLSGNGKLGGTMRLDKMGESTLTINGTHDFSGVTEIWEGELIVHGGLSQSPVSVRRHAHLSGKAILNSINTEYNASIFVGGENTADTLRVTETIKLVEGAKLYFDVADTPEGNHDHLMVDGTLELDAKSIIAIHQMGNNLAPGKYLLAKVEQLIGLLSAVKINGAVGVATELVYDETTKELSLIVKGVRSAGSVVWSGIGSAIWDLANNTNWNNDGFADIFVTNDSVLFTGTGINRTVLISENLSPSFMKVDSHLDYTFDGNGELSGSMELHKTNTGRLTINNRNSFTGRTVVEGGTLIMKYAPSTTNTGAIGPNNNSTAHFVVRDSAMIQVTTNNEITGRGLTLAGAAGGLMNVSNTLYWNGPITGTRLTKLGTGTLFLGNNNSTLNELVLKTGTVDLNVAGAVPFGPGKKLIMEGGTLRTFNSTGTYLTSSHAIEVPTGSTATYIAGARCEYNGALTGGGILNWHVDFIRSYINGNWSGFSGRINLVKNTANSTYEDKFIVNTTSGFPQATISIPSGVIMCYKNGTADNGTNTIKVGMLTGVAGAVYHNAGLEVGANNTSGTYAGIFTGVTTLRKVGTGNWVLSGTNTNTGSTTVVEGTMTVSGTLGSGQLTIMNGGLMFLGGTAGGSAGITLGGILHLTGSLGGSVNNSGLLRGNGTIGGNVTGLSGSSLQPGGPITGSINITGNLTQRTGSKLEVQVNGGSNPTSDRINIGGIMTCAGTLEITRHTGVYVTGSNYQIFNAGGIAGTFDEILLPELEAGMAWDLESLYTEGVLRIINDISAVPETVMRSGLMENPTHGHFRVQITSEGHLQYTIADLSGRILASEMVLQPQGLLHIHLTDKPSGVYLLRLKYADGKEESLRLMKQ